MINRQVTSEDIKRGNTLINNLNKEFINTVADGQTEVSLSIQETAILIRFLNFMFEDYNRLANQERLRQVNTKKSDEVEEVIYDGNTGA
jgi:hypothetical protein